MKGIYQNPHFACTLNCLLQLLNLKGVFFISFLIDSFYGEKKITSLSTMQFKDLNIKES